MLFIQLNVVHASFLPCGFSLNRPLESKPLHLGKIDGPQLQVHLDIYILQRGMIQFIETAV